MNPGVIAGRASAAVLIAPALVFAVAALAVAALAVSAPAAAQAPTQTQAQPKSAQIDRNGVLILVRSTLLALHAANETGNYTVLRDLGAPGFREVNDSARLAEIFGKLRAQKLDLSGIAVLDPQLTLLPQIEADGSMRLAGFFPSIPLQINFELQFAPVNGRWRPFGISVGLGTSGPTAPEAAAPRPAAPETATPKASASKPGGSPSAKDGPAGPAAKESQTTPPPRPRRSEQPKDAPAPPRDGAASPPARPAPSGAPAEPAQRP